MGSAAGRLRGRVGDTKPSGLQHLKEHLADEVENGPEGARLKARGHEESSALSQVRGSGSVHDGFYHSGPAPSAGGSERENTRRVSLPHGNVSWRILL